MHMFINKSQPINYHQSTFLNRVSIPMRKKKAMKTLSISQRRLVVKMNILIYARSMSTLVELSTSAWAASMSAKTMLSFKSATCRLTTMLTTVTRSSRHSKTFTLSRVVTAIRYLILSNLAATRHRMTVRITRSNL